MNSITGRCALQQALVLVHGLSYRKAASIAGVHHRSCWQHVQARHGSNIKPWSARTFEEKTDAAGEALRLIINAQ
jgi:hypothetical protein